MTYRICVWDDPKIRTATLVARTATRKRTAEREYRRLCGVFGPECVTVHLVFEFAGQTVSKCIRGRY